MVIDSNLSALRQYDAKLQKDSDDYEQMIDELSEALGEQLQELYEIHEKIVKKYGFDQKFIDTVKELL